MTDSVSLWMSQRDFRFIPPLNYYAAFYSVQSVQSSVPQHLRHHALYFVLPMGRASHDGRESSGGSSLTGQRSIADFWHILDHLIEAINTDNYRLQRLDDERRPLAGPPVKRSSPGNIVAGNHLIKSAVEGGKITFKPILMFFDFPFERTDLPSKLTAKRAKRDGEGYIASERSSRDPSDDS